MLTEIISFFKEHGYGIMYIMFFFFVILFVFSTLNNNINNNNINTSNNGSEYNINDKYISFIDRNGKNILFAIFFIIIVFSTFSMIGYSFGTSSTSSPSTSPPSAAAIAGAQIAHFFSEYGTTILNVVILFITLLVTFSIMGVNFNPSKINKTVQKVVTIESFDGNFCKTYETNPAELNKKCNLLTEENCTLTSCCGWLNGTTCVASNKANSNPIYFTDSSGNKIKVKSWHSKKYNGKQ